MLLERWTDESEASALISVEVTPRSTYTADRGYQQPGMGDTEISVIT